MYEYQHREEGQERESQGCPDGGEESPHVAQTVACLDWRLGVISIMSKTTANSAQATDLTTLRGSLISAETSKNTFINATQKTEKRERQGND